MTTTIHSAPACTITLDDHRAPDFYADGTEPEAWADNYRLPTASERLAYDRALLERAARIARFDAESATQSTDADAPF